VAVTREREVGVDVEAVRPERDLEQIATRFFSSLEVASLLAEPPEERPAAFYRCWTRKEAYMKAVGDGFAIPLDSFDVVFGLNAPACLLANRLAPEEVQRWSMAAIDPGYGYAAALVVEGGEWSGQYFEETSLSS
jgi:4'-phosphopantetheinyl transferase